MKAAVFHAVEDLRIEQVPDPAPGPGDLVMRIGAAGICGTDLRIFHNGHYRLPVGTKRILGHELSGEVVAVGKGVSGVAVGMHIAVAPNIGCGVCAECVAGWTNLCADYRALGISLDGAFAEFMLVPADALRQGNVVEIPAGTPHAAAALAEPLSCCLNGQEAVSVGCDDVVLVVGAGPIGLMHLHLARLSGARRVIVSEISDERLAQARDQGADLVLNPAREEPGQAVQEFTDGRGPDVVIVAAPSREAQGQAIALAARRGRVNFFAGLPKDSPAARLDSNLIHYKQLLVTGTTGSNVRQYRAALSLAVHRRIDLDRIIGARLPLDLAAQGLQRTAAGVEMRLILEPGRRA